MLIFIPPISYVLVYLLTLAFLKTLLPISLVKKHLNKTLEIEGAILTMYDIRTNLSNQVVKEVKKYFDNKVYKTVICIQLFLQSMFSRHL